MTIEIFNADCMGYMKECSDNYFDLAIVDPPYGIGENGSTNKSRGGLATPKDYEAFSGADKEPPSLEYFKELKRVSKNQIIFGANHFAGRFDSSSQGWIIWDKENGASSFADAEMAYTSFNRATRIFKFRWSGMLQGDMKNKEHRIHPTQKPVKLYNWILANYADPSQLILDTHLGSRSSAIAAHYFGCRFVGLELSEHYYSLALIRFEEATRQLDIFADGTREI